jgi:hypothetical protein
MNDELILLWRQGTSAEPNPQEVARLAGRATMTRFDKTILRRNLIEYFAGGFLLIANLRSLWTGPYVAAPLGLITGVLFVMLYFWHSHRTLVPLDAAADARTYHVAMLARLDHQIRLLSTVRYWYILPLYLPIVVQTYTLPNPPGQKVVALTLVTGLCVGVIWFNEKHGVRRLRTERAKVESLYREESTV